MAVGYARDESKEKPKANDKSKDESESSVPEFTTLQQWEPVKSTKMDTCAKICQYMLTRDNLPEPIFKGGQVIFPDIPRTSPTIEKKETKILIYQEFTSLRPLLRNVTLLYLSLQFYQLLITCLLDSFAVRCFHSVNRWTDVFR